MIAVDRHTILAPNGKLAALEAIRNNWYEGSRWSPNRKFIWFPLQEANRDLDRFTRYELNKHARYLYKNSPFIRGLIERLVSLTIGSGFHPVFKSSDASWSARAARWWKKKSRNPHLGPRCTMSQYFRCLGRARFVDGEAFTIKTFDETSYEDKIQGVEADRVTGGKPEQSEAGGSVDGLNKNSQGVTTSYSIRGTDYRYPAEDIVHHFTPTRLGQDRGETILSAAINTSRDVEDILGLEKQAVKDSSSKMDIIKRAHPELDPEMFRNLRYGTGLTTAFSLPADDRTKDDYYRTQFGAQPVLLQTGDEYTPYIPNRPGNAWQGFMAFLANTICLSTNLPPSVVLPIDVGGTDIRRDLDIAQRVVEPWQLDIACEADDILDYFIQPEIIDGELNGAPDDWSVHWHFPAKLNVDRAQAQQDRNDVQAGLMSVEEYHGRYGDDGDSYDAEVIAEAKKRKERIMAAGFEDVQEFLQVMSLNPLAFQKNEAREETVTK